MSDIKQVIVLRKDLGMRKGKMCAQAAHASMKVFLDKGAVGSTGMLSIDLTPEMGEWVEGIFTKVVVGCDSEEALLDLVEKAKAAGLPHALITDAGKTEFHGQPTHTAVAIGPGLASAIDPITGHLPLL